MKKTTTVLFVTRDAVGDQSCAIWGHEPYEVRGEWLPSKAGHTPGLSSYEEIRPSMAEFLLGHAIKPGEIFHRKLTPPASERTPAPRKRCA
jgi:hypothetical protein